MGSVLCIVMKVVKGNKLEEVDVTELIKQYSRLVIDLGTGDGKFVYKNALTHPDTLFIGIDPAPKQLQIYARKAARKKLPNVLFAPAAAENIPQELTTSADEVFIILPWGTLLQYVAAPDTTKLIDIIGLLKPEGKLNIIFGYSPEFEPSEFERLGLAKISGEYIEKKLVPAYTQLGLELVKFSILNKSALRELETTWSKKLAFGQKRPIFHLVFEKREYSII